MFLSLFPFAVVTAICSCCGNSFPERNLIQTANDRICISCYHEAVNNEEEEKENES